MVGEIETTWEQQKSGEAEYRRQGARLVVETIGLGFGLVAPGEPQQVLKALAGLRDLAAAEHLPEAPKPAGGTKRAAGQARTRTGPELDRVLAELRALPRTAAELGEVLGCTTQVAALAISKLAKAGRVHRREDKVWEPVEAV